MTWLMQRYHPKHGMCIVTITVHSNGLVPFSQKKVRIHCRTYEHPHLELYFCYIWGCENLRLWKWKWLTWVWQHKNGDTEGSVSSFPELSYLESSLRRVPGFSELLVFPSLPLNFASWASSPSANCSVSFVLVKSQVIVFLVPRARLFLLQSLCVGKGDNILSKTSGSWRLMISSGLPRGCPC